MPLLAKRALLAALTAVGLVILAFGAWFTAHLGVSGTATFQLTPPSGAVVVLEPSVLNRVDASVTVTAHARSGGPVFLGAARPVDASDVVGGADRATVLGADVTNWSLRTERAGAGPAGNLTQTDVWRESSTGRGTGRLTVDPSDAPETVVVAQPDGSAAQLSSVTLTVQRVDWSVEAILLVLLGAAATVIGVVGLRRLGRPSQEDS